MKDKILNFGWIILQHVLPSKIYLSLKYYVIFKKRMSWEHPLSLSEKLQWIKLYGCKPEYQRMVDKVSAKSFFAETVGQEYVLPLLGVWDSVDDIDFDSLPKQFVLKCNHDSGTIVICNDKEKFNISEAKKLLKKALRRNYYLAFRETPYKHINRKIFAEPFIQNDGLGELLDYKFFCFNGEPKIMKIDFGRMAHNQHSNYYDTDMNLLPYGLAITCPLPERVFDKPENYDVMLNIAKQLSAGIPFVRVDMYNVSGKIYVGEMTFFPASGLSPYTSDSVDQMLGSWIELPEKNA